MLASTSRRQDSVPEIVADATGSVLPAVLRHLPGTIWRGSRPLEPVRHLPTDIARLDVLLGGGLPRGAISELCGAPSSGRSALMGALLAAATRRGEVTAVVDCADALHPPSLAAAGVDLARVLWVRPSSLQASLKCGELILAAGGFGLAVLDLSDADVRELPAHVWPRLTRAARQSGTALMVLARQQVTGSFGAIRLALDATQPRWNEGAWRLLEGLTTRVVLARSKHGTVGEFAAFFSSFPVSSSFPLPLGEGQGEGGSISGATKSQAAVR